MSGRLPARFALPLTALMLSGVVTIIISGISTFRALAFPTVLVVLPIVRRLVARIVAAP